MENRVSRPVPPPGGAGSHSTKQPRWLKEWVVRAMMVAVSLVLTCVAAEMFLRVVAPQPLNTLRVRPDGVLSHVPGLDFILHGTEYRTRVKTNADGLRDVDRPQAKPFGITRVLVLGDSMIEGLQVDLPFTMPKQLQQRLKQAFPVRGFDVINAGVSGSSGPQAARYLEKDGLLLDPDLVVVTFTARNDVRDAALDHDRPLPRAYGLRTALRSRLHLYSLLERALNASARLRNAVASFGLVAHAAPQRHRPEGIPTISLEALLYDGRLSEWERKGYERLFESYDRILELCGARDIPVLFVLIPTYFQATGFSVALGHPLQVMRIVRNARETQERVLAFLNERGVETLDLLPSMQKNAEDLFFRNDQHFTARGNALAARKTAQAILEKPLMLARLRAAWQQVARIETSGNGSRMTTPRKSAQRRSSLRLANPAQTVLATEPGAQNITPFAKVFRQGGI